MPAKSEQTHIGFDLFFASSPVKQEVLEEQAIFGTPADPEPFAENSHATGRPETITSDDRNGFSMRESLVVGGHR